MTDFLPIKLGRNVDGVVTHLQEISSSDKIPEPFLQVSSNVLPNWNASGLQGFLVSSTTPSAGNALVWNAGINAWVPSTVTATGGGAGLYNASAIDGIPVDMPPGPIFDSKSRLLYFNRTQSKIILDDKNIYDPALGLMTIQGLTASTVVTTGAVSATGDLNVSGNIYHFGSFINVYDGDVNVSGAVISQTVSATTYENLPVSSVVWASANYAVFAGSATSSLNARYAPNNFDVTGNITTDTQVVENYLAVYSGIPAIPADSRFYVQGKSYLQGQTQVNNNLIVTGTVSANTVSATQYQNLPSSVIVWASANYAVFAGSATNSQNATNAASATLAAQATSATFAYFSASATTALTATSASLSYQATSATQALNSTNAASATIAAQATSATSSINAQQAPNGFNVTGTLSAPTISATNYLNIGNTIAQWNASALQGSPVSANLTPTANQSLVYNGSVWTASSIVTGGGGVTDHGALTGLADDDHPQYVLSATNSALSSTVSNHIASASVHFTQAQIDHGVILGLGDNDHPQYVLSSTNSSLSSLVDSHIASASVHFTQAEIDHGVILGLGDNDHPQYVLSATNSALSSTVSNHIASAVHWELSTLNINYINASGDSANAAFYFQTVSATTVSATNYLNLPSSPVTIPDPLTVSTLYAGLVSATEYRNVRPYVSAVDSATTTTVNINGGYDTFLVNTTTTSVTLYLPDASAYPDRKITVSKIDDGGSYRSVTLSGAQLQTATNTVRLYDPTESVTVISNGTNWYSMDYDRAYGVVVVCKNSTGATLTKGTPVRVTGATGANVLIGPVSASNTHVPQAPNGSLSRCIGVVEHNIPNGEFGHVLTKGVIYKFNTNAYNEGDILYLAPSGGFTNVKPASPYDEVFLGIVTRKQAVNGSILIDVANPIHINDIVGFDLTSSLVNGDLISYSTATSTFTNVQNVSVSGQGKFGSVSATNYFNLPSGVGTWNANKLQGYDISAVAPSNDQVLKYNSTLSAWVPGTDTTGGGGGIADASSLRGVPLSATLVPTAGQALMYNGSVWTASAALFAYTYGSGAPTGGSDGDIYLQTDVVALQVPSVSATTYLNLPQTDASSLMGTAFDPAFSPIYDLIAWDSINGYWISKDSTDIVNTAVSACGPVSGSYLVINNDSLLSAERKFATGGGLAANDGGANGTYTVSANYTSAIWQPSATFGTVGQTVTTLGDFKVDQTLLATSGDVSSTRLTDYSEKKSAPTISSSALTLDLNNSQVFTVALNSNISTLTISNVEARANTAQGFTLILTADGTARTISWPGSVKWPSGTGPTLTSTNTKVDILSFLTPDNGTTWYGFVGGQNF